MISLPTIKFPLTPILLLVAAALMAVEGTWGLGLYRHWSFAVLLVLMLLELAFTMLTDLNRKAFCSLMSHLGLFLVLFGGLFGSPCVKDLSIKLYAGGPAENLAFAPDGTVEMLPFAISLQDFSTDYYADGTTPKQFTSCICIDGKELKTSVNHPCRYRGYRIYQAGYGIGKGNDMQDADDVPAAIDLQTGRYSVLQLVRDPWLPVVALGALLLAISAILGLKKTWNSSKIIVAAVALAVVFALLSLARISLATLPPALRSLWFAPHLIVYMLAYSVMALSVLSGLASLFSAKVPANLSGRLLRTASSLMLIGMICGAVWAKQAWGNYWTWDGKECWAAATWLLTLVGSHLPRRNNGYLPNRNTSTASDRKLALAFTILAFAAMQMTWYGVNYLPTAEHSVHTYNQRQK